MSGLMESVLGSLDQGTIAGIAQQLGTNPQQAQGAIQAALPLILGAMGRNAATPQGADSLHRALSKDHAQTDVMSVIGGMLGGGGQQESNPLLSIGKSVLGSIMGGGQQQAQSNSMGGAVGQAILGHVFGGKQQRAAQGLGQVTGLGGDSAGKLMAILAPIVMSVLAKKMSSGGLNAQGVSQVLGQEHQRIQQHAPTGGMLSAVLDRDGDGDVDFADLMANAGMIGKMLGK